MLTRSLIALALLSSNPFLVCAPQAQQADAATDTSATDTTTTTTDVTTTDPTMVTTTESTLTTSTGPATCGNGIPEADEACDDGNDDNTDDCTDKCELPACADGYTQANEECDDGNTADDDACSPDCKNAVCGDALVWTGVEECDEGPDNGSATCTVDCKIPICGDGIQSATESCDNGPNNIDKQDAQPEDCTTECQIACGDGTLSIHEECDDANPTPGDGCTPLCEHEYLMFATQELYPANFGGISAADTICQSAATTANLPGTYVAWLSIDMDSALTDLPSGKPLVRPDGQPIAATAEDLIKGAMTVLLNSINLDASSNEVTGYAWTGTTPSGTPSGGDCTGWTVANGNASDIGAVNSTSSTWTKDPGPDPFDQIKCDAQNHLYCLRTLEP